MPLVQAGTVAVADLEVRPERLDGGGGELFGDEDDGAVGHSGVLCRIVRVETCTTLCALATVPVPMVCF